MSTHRLGIVATVFNPTGSKLIAANYARFADEVLAASGRDCVVTEVLYEGQSPSIPEAVHLHKPTRFPLWDKEAALNVAASLLPAHCTAVAWLDADITFTNPDWVQATEAALQDEAVVQLFRRSQWLNRHGKPGRTTESWASTQPRYGHPGFAWAARREIFPIDDIHIVGNADIFCAAAWSGKFRHPQSARYPEAAHRAWLIRAWQQYQQTGGRIGLVEGDVLHHWHGERKHRQYTSRLDILSRHQFDPATDIRRLDNGLLDWIPGHKPQMQEEVRQYFVDRRDDG